MTMCVTGGSGFIGSHLATALKRRGEDVYTVDKIAASMNNSTQCDLSKDFKSEIISADTVFHFAASTDVRNSMINPRESAENNIIATHNVLEACRKQDVKNIVFASSSAVYGNAEVIPTPEHATLRPVSVYGATKAACEMLITAYHESYGIDAVILRYANIYGPGSTHGVMHDFVQKLTAGNKVLEILGDGLQNKSYLYIGDAIEATLLAADKTGWKVFNIGSEKQTTVSEIARLITDAMGLENAKLKFTGGQVGWLGDIPRFLLDVGKIKSLGWTEKTDIKTGIGNYVKWLVSKNE